MPNFKMNGEFFLIVTYCWANVMMIYDCLLKEFSLSLRLPDMKLGGFREVSGHLVLVSISSLTRQQPEHHICCLYFPSSKRKLAGGWDTSNLVMKASALISSLLCQPITTSTVQEKKRNPKLL